MLTGMKRKIHDLRAWPRAARHEQVVLHLPGHVIVDFTAHEVIRPLDVPFGDRVIRVLDHGYRWVRVHPTGGGEAVMGDALTAMLDEHGIPRQLYVDVHGGEGIGEDGLPWIDDLYLDVIGNWEVGPERAGQVTETHIIDGEELDEAVQEGRVTAAHADATWAHARKVEAALIDGTYPLLAILRRYLEDPYT